MVVQHPMEVLNKGDASGRNKRGASLSVGVQTLRMTQDDPNGDATQVMGFTAGTDGQCAVVTICLLLAPPPY